MDSRYRRIWNRKRSTVILERRPIIKQGAVITLCALSLPVSSCTTEALQALAAPSANFSPQGQIVQRTIQVGYINNTPFRAIFTFGAYDPLDQETLPTAFRQLRLEGNTASQQFAQPCRQVFSVGDPELIRLIELNEGDPAINVNDPRALIRGINFSGAALGDPLEAEPTEGNIEGRVVVNGVGFTCARPDIRDPQGTGLLLFTFEEDVSAPGGFRIDFDFFEQ